MDGPGGRADFGRPDGSFFGYELPVSPGRTAVDGPGGGRTLAGRRTLFSAVSCL